MAEQQTFRPGELVDITIRGAKVQPEGAPTLLVVTLAGDDDGPRMVMPAEHSSMTVERVAPPEWPPRQGDLWRDRNGSLWFAYREPARTDGYGTLAGAYIAMKASDPAYPHERTRSDQLLSGYGPLTLVHREYPDPDDDGDGE